MYITVVMSPDCISSPITSSSSCSCHFQTTASTDFFIDRLFLLNGVLAQLSILAHLIESRLLPNQRYSMRPAVTIPTLNGRVNLPSAGGTYSVTDGWHAGFFGQQRTCNCLTGCTVPSEQTRLKLEDYFL